MSQYDDPEVRQPVLPRCKENVKITPPLTDDEFDKFIVDENSPLIGLHCQPIADTMYWEKCRILYNMDREVEQMFAKLEVALHEAGYYEGDALEHLSGALGLIEQYVRDQLTPEQVARLSVIEDEYDFVREEIIDGCRITPPSQPQGFIDHFAIDFTNGVRSRLVESRAMAEAQRAAAEEARLAAEAKAAKDAEMPDPMLDEREAPDHAPLSQDEVSKLAEDGQISDEMAPAADADNVALSTGAASAGVAAAQPAGAGHPEGAPPGSPRSASEAARDIDDPEIGKAKRHGLNEPSRMGDSPDLHPGGGSPTPSGDQPPPSATTPPAPVAAASNAYAPSVFERLIGSGFNAIGGSAHALLTGYKSAMNGFSERADSRSAMAMAQSEQLVKISNDFKAQADAFIAAPATDEKAKQDLGRDLQATAIRLQNQYPAAVEAHDLVKASDKPIAKANIAKAMDQFKESTNDLSKYASGLSEHERIAEIAKMIVQLLNRIFSKISSRFSLPGFGLGEGAGQKEPDQRSAEQSADDWDGPADPAGPHMAEESPAPTSPSVAAGAPTDEAEPSHAPSRSPSPRM